MENPDPEETPRPPDDFWSRRRWLARFSFSFLIVAVYLVYTAYQGSKNHSLTEGRTILLYVGAMFAFVLFLMGTKERHRRE